MEHQPLSAEEERIAKGVVGAACAVHGALGPDLLESVYGGCSGTNRQDCGEYEGWASRRPPSPHPLPRGQRKRRGGCLRVDELEPNRCCTEKGER